MQGVFGHQGHPGRYAPWNYERQFDSFFHSLGLNWLEVARDKQHWAQHQHAWLRHMLGSRAQCTYLAKY
eukprot:7664281-Karenia_brevis.AAC.1